MPSSNCQIRLTMSLYFSHICGHGNQQPKNNSLKIVSVYNTSDRASSGSTTLDFSLAIRALLTSTALWNFSTVLLVKEATRCSMPEGVCSNVSSRSTSLVSAGNKRE